MKKRTQKKAFTLVELLVVISIIAILAGLSFPAISSALAKARQGADVSNIRQIGTIMFTYASDNNFRYPGGTDAADVFQTLIDEGYLNNYDILVTSGSNDTAFNGSGTLANENVSYSVMVTAGSGGTGSTPTGVSDNAHDQLPLLFSADGGLDGITVPTSPVSTAGTTTITGDGPWGTDGVTVFRKGNSASFLKANPDPGGGTGAIIPAKNALFPVGFSDANAAEYGVATGK